MRCLHQTHLLRAQQNMQKSYKDCMMKSRKLSPKTDALMNLQRLWQHPQDCQRFKPDRLPELCWGRGHVPPSLTKMTSPVNIYLQRKKNIISPTESHKVCKPKLRLVVMAKTKELNGIFVGFCFNIALFWLFKQSHWSFAYTAWFLIMCFCGFYVCVFVMLFCLFFSSLFVCTFVFQRKWHGVQWVGS